MKSIILTTTTIAALVTAPAFADAFTDSIIADLGAQGYTSIEIENGPTQVKVEASNGTTEIVLIYDRATGQVLSQETEASDDVILSNAESQTTSIEITTTAPKEFGKKSENETETPTEDITTVASIPTIDEVIARRSRSRMFKIVRDFTDLTKREEWPYSKRANSFKRTLYYN